MNSTQNTLEAYKMTIELAEAKKNAAYEAMKASTCEADWVEHKAEFEAAGYWLDVARANYRAEFDRLYKSEEESSPIMLCGHSREYYQTSAGECDVCRAR